MSELDALAAMLRGAGLARVYEVGAVPASPVYPYADVSAMRLAPTIRTLDVAGNNPRRFVVRFFARTHAAVTDLANIALATLDGQALDLSGTPVAWCEVASGVYRDPDDEGVLTLTHTYRYA